MVNVWIKLYEIYLQYNNVYVNENTLISVDWKNLVDTKKY